MIDEILKESFDGQIKKVFAKNPKIEKFLLEHERRPVCLKNMWKLVKDTEKLYPLKRSDVEYVGKSYADTFAKAALQHAEEQSISKLERSRRIRVAEEREEFSKQFNDGTLFQENTDVTSM